MSWPMMSRRVLARPSRLVAAICLIASSGVITFTYLVHRQPHLLPQPWTYDATQGWGWEWDKMGENWRSSGVLRDPMEEHAEPGSIGEDPELGEIRQRDMTCYEAVERDMRVALYDFTPFHDEVVGSILASLNDTGIHTDVYRPNFRYGFSDILDTFFPTDNGKELHYWTHLFPKLEAKEYDALFLTSCDERWIQPQLLDILPTLTDIPIICLHHEMWSFDLHRTRLIDSAKAGKLSFFTLGEHVRTLVKVENTEPWTEDGKDGDFAWTDVPVEVFVPIFPLPESISLPTTLPKQIIPNDVAILGDVKSDGRRNYAKLWRDLIAAIRENPASWGYTISPENGYFIPSSDSSDVQPFRVHLFGRLYEGVSIPPVLEEHVIVFHAGLDYVDYYRELSKLDLVLPILGNDEYIRNRATAAFPAGIISRIPSLVTPSILKGYNYLEPPAVILHPDGTNEVEILAAMRRGEDPWTAIQQPENESGSDRDWYMRSDLLDSQLENRPSSKPKEWDWDGYVDDVRAYNSKLMCKTLLR